jgi:hypothetical protein
VWPLAVVVLAVNAQDAFQVAAAEDQQPVETFGADGADEALGVGVRLGRAHGRAEYWDAFAAEHLVERGGELAVAVVEQEVDPFEEAGEAQVARLLTTQAASGSSCNRRSGRAGRPAR